VSCARQIATSASEYGSKVGLRYPKIALLEPVLRRCRQVFPGSPGASAQGGKIPREAYFRPYDNQWSWKCTRGTDCYGDPVTTPEVAPSAGCRDVALVSILRLVAVAEISQVEFIFQQTRATGLLRQSADLIVFAVLFALNAHVIPARAAMGSGPVPRQTSGRGATNWT
jgi:hypothetical protein